MGVKFKVEGANTIGESLSTVLAEIFGEEGCPCGQKLRGDSELRRFVVEKKRVSGSGLGLVVAHGYYYYRHGSIVVKEGGGVVTIDFYIYQFLCCVVL